MEIKIEIASNLVLIKGMHFGHSLPTIAGWQRIGVNSVHADTNAIICNIGIRVYKNVDIHFKYLHPHHVFTNHVRLVIIHYSHIS